MPAARLLWSRPALLCAVIGISCAKDEPPGPLADASEDGCDVVAFEPEISAPPVFTPRWAFEPWISQGVSDEQGIRALLSGFAERQLPAGVVVIDSPWETHYNTFVPSDRRYPKLGELVAHLHAQKVRVVLWMTQMVNRWYHDEKGGDWVVGPSPNFEFAKTCGFFVDEGQTYSWWKGGGAAVDFFHPQARAWWHEQQNALLDLGINGWKLDVGDAFVRSDPVQTAQGQISHQEYSEAYYRDFFAYGAHRKGGLNEFVTLARAWDQPYGRSARFHARPEHAPVAYVGEKRRDWRGLSDALEHVFRSSRAGYADPLGDPIPFDRAVFERWLAVGALMPWMHWRGSRDMLPWAMPGCEGDCAQKMLDQHRFWLTFHHELVPFFYSLAHQARAGGAAVLTAHGEPSAWLGDYRFSLGEALLVAPILDDTAIRDIVLPEGQDYYDFWHPEDDDIAGGTILRSYHSPPGQIPLFVRQGAIIPLQVSDEVTGLGTTASRDAWTVLVYPSAKTTSFDLQDTDDVVTTFHAIAGKDTVEVTFSRAIRAVVLQVRMTRRPGQVKLGDAAVPERETRDSLDVAASGWWMDTARQAVWVIVPPSPSPQHIRFLWP